VGRVLAHRDMFILLLENYYYLETRKRAAKGKLGW
jgi:hypothetical protein